MEELQEIKEEKKPEGKKCLACNGRGYLIYILDSEKVMCPKCNGRGRITKDIPDPRTLKKKTCPDCHGEGRRRKVSKKTNENKICLKCHGSGKIEDKHEKVRIR